jgi:diaminopropionate ammonia-lyase
MRILMNDRRKRPTVPADIPYPSTDIDAVRSLLHHCPSHHITPLVRSDALATSAGVGTIYVKDESDRMSLGSFKALGAAYAIAREASLTGAADQATALNGTTYVTASAGNHGSSVAAGARIFGAKSVIYIAETVPEGFAARLQSYGAQVIREGADYEASMAAALAAADAHGWRLLSDSSWAGYTELPFRVMEGYLEMAAEIVEQMPSPATHIFLQAGVGGMAASVAAYLRKTWGDDPLIAVVEPENAPALLESLAIGRPIEAPGPASIMGRLDCKVPSLIALKGLARDADAFLTLGDQSAESVLTSLGKAGFQTSPSGGAGLAALLTASADIRSKLRLDQSSRVLTIMSEGAIA